MVGGLGTEGNDLQSTHIEDTEYQKPHEQKLHPRSYRSATPGEYRPYHRIEQLAARDF